MKKTLLKLSLGCTALITAAAFAGSHARADHFSGFSVGLGAGISGLSTSIDVNDNNADVVAADLGKQGAAFNVEAGYGKVTGQAFLGAKLFYQRNTNNEITLNDNIFSLSNYHVKYAAGLVGELGVLMSPNFLVYAEAGAQRVRFSYKFVDAGHSTFNEAKTNTAFVWGLGFRYATTKDVKFGLEYRYSALSNYSVELNNVGFPEANQIAIKQNMNTLLANVSYTFNT
jgi:opacity protein-like surface antigen